MRLTGEKIKYYREHLGMTQGELCKTLGITTSMLSAIERGERRLTQSIEIRALDKFIQSRDEMNRIITEIDSLKGDFDG